MTTVIDRRHLLRAAALSGGTAALGLNAGGCTQQSPAPSPAAATSAPAPSPTSETATAPAAPSGRVLLAYFSRPGENYYYGGRRDLEVGNTERLATMIAAQVDCDVYRIEAADPYPDSYDETVDRNGAEQRAQARPALARALPDITGYDTILLGSPIWNVRPPRIMLTFVEGLDLSAKTVFPFVTYAVSGLGRTVEDYAAAVPTVRLGQGLAVQGEKVTDAAADVDAWVSDVLAVP